MMTLQVIVARDDDGWAAQAIEVDYAAGGNSADDVRRRFLMGLGARAAEELRKTGTLAQLKTPAAPEDWIGLVTGTDATVARVEREPLALRSVGLTFDTVAYILIEPAGVEAGTTVH